MLYRLSLVPIFLLLYVGAGAQKKYLGGYIVKNSGDTVKGFIEYRSWEYNPNKIIFKKDSLTEEKEEHSSATIKAFSIPGFDQFEKYTCPVSMEPTSIDELRLSSAENNANITAFFRVVSSYDDLKLLSYRDDLKERFFIMERGSDLPYELIYKVYYRSNNENTVVKEEIYKSQLINLAGKQRAVDENLRRKIDRVPYSHLPIKNIVRQIILSNPGQQQIVERADDKTKFQVAALVGYNMFEFKEPESNKASNNGFCVGLFADFNPNKLLNNYFIRLELTYAGTRYESTSTEFDPFGFRRVYDKNITQPFLSFISTFNYHVFKSASTDIYLGAGAGYTVCFATKHVIKESVYGGNNPDGVFFNYNYRKTLSNLPVRAQLGAKFSRNFVINLFHTRNVFDTPTPVDFTGVYLAYVFK